ncbi:hypothetical protein JOF41_001806 [Saccharothrix coeruleofusca]|uniref:hypothetical protein n=1 Tax=Saccharothrix coeruleofusca TaxID=33919 RepID=UPI001AE995BE|nr:hypothetical protein [Saccharothrix coeruleofusca]MBP2335628.1 hypothetical protein [Saccharothrix coeruleofusca]
MTIVRLWLRAHRWPTLAATSCLVAVAGLVLGGRHVPIPSLSGARGLSVPLSQLLPLLLACAVALRTRAPTTVFRVVPRSPVPQRAALLVTCLVTVAAACPLLPDGQTALRNLAGLTGMALATATIAGATRGWTLPLLHLMCCLLFGAHPRHTPQGGIGARWWAFAIADADDRTAMAVALLLCAVGSLLFVLRGPRDETAPHD